VTGDGRLVRVVEGFQVGVSFCLNQSSSNLGSDRFHQGYFILLPLVGAEPQWCNSTMPNNRP